MSAGGQNSTAFVGAQSMRIRDASDITQRDRLQGVYRMFNSTAPRALRNRTPNGNDSFLQFLQSRKEGCETCVGLPYQPLTGLSFRN
jgi:hypothetical protein